MAYGKRRRKRPRPRKRIDKVQNKRIKRLEDATEKKYAYAKLHQVSLSSTVTNTSQMYEMVPHTTNSTDTNDRALYADGGRIGNQISLRNIKSKFTLHNSSTTESIVVRVIFFWLKQAATFVTSAGDYPPTSGALSPTWQQLLNSFVLAPTATNGMENINAHQQQLTKSNKVPIIILSDKLYNLGATELSNRTRTVTFQKSYKAMKLTYNDSPDQIVGGVPAGNVRPLNRQLFMAVCTSHNSGMDSLSLCADTMMLYTDA